MPGILIASTDPTFRCPRGIALHHDIRMTAKKIARRLTLIAPLAHRRSAPLSPLRFKPLDSPTAPPPLDPQLDDTGWQVVPPGTYWGGHNVNFALRGEFIVPSDFDPPPQWRCSCPSATPVRSAIPKRWPTSTARPMPPPTATTRRFLLAARPPRRPAAPPGAARLDGRSATDARDDGQAAVHAANAPWCRLTSPRATSSPRRARRCRPPTCWTISNRPRRACSTRSTPPSTCWTRASRSATPSTPACQRALQTLRDGHRRRRPAARRRDHRRRARPHRRGLAVDAGRRRGAKPGARSTPCCG